MRKLSAITVAAAAALLVAAPAVPAFARAHDPAVLTIGKAGGTAVKVGAKLEGSLKKGTKASFLVSGSKGVFCSSVSFTDVVKKNPAKGRKATTATESLTKQTFGHCTVSSGLGATGVHSVVLVKLPYTTTISDARGDPVVVSGTKAALTLNTVLGNITCTYAANKGKTNGSSSNQAHSISFSKQGFTLSSGPPNVCPKHGSFSATFSPVKDVSVKGSPLIFVN